MRRPLAVLLIAALPMLLTAGPARSEDESRIADLRMGTYWYGAEVTKADLVGKVVLVELWGS